MTGMEHAMKRAVRVILDANAARIARYPMVEPISVQAARQYARALADAGLLAPASLREEWGVRWDDHDIWGDMYQNRAEAQIGAGDEGTPVHRYVTDWGPLHELAPTERGTEWKTGNP